MRKKNSILIVDDDASNLHELTSILSSEYKIFVLKDGASALEKASEALPDLILLDIIMPDMNGFDVLTELKKSEKTKNIPVIFITGINDNESEREGLATGAVDYIRKPFDAMVVKHRVWLQIQIINLQRELKNAAAAAEAANQSKSSFLANMSHEIRTPMNAIMGITDILLQNEELSGEVAEGLDKIYASSDMLLGIINDILDFSKIEAGKLDIMPAEYRVANLINDSSHLNMMKIGEKPIEFELCLNENIPVKFIGDELRIKQILNNLLSNAFKYTDEGKVTMSVAYEREPERNKAVIIFSVRDTGQGMTEEQLGRLFDEYSRFNESANRTVEGTGLGLSITLRLINLMNGTIQVESEPGKGSLFTVRLPQGMVDDEVLCKEVTEKLKQFHLSDLVHKKNNKLIREPMPYGKVLVVDDVKMNLFVAERLMKPYKLWIETALSGRRAIEEVTAGKSYDIIFMDHMMPEMDGIEVTKQIRYFGYNRPIVALTANAVAGQSDVFLASGFDAFISKPIDIRQLDSILKKYIRDKQPPETIEAARLQNKTSSTNNGPKLKNEKISGLNIAKGLEKYEDDEKIYTKIIRSYASSARSLISTIDEVNEANLADYRLRVHSIKGMSLDIYADEIGTTAADLEKAAIIGDFDYIKVYNPAFIESTWKIINDIEAMLKAIKARNSLPKKDKLDKDLLLQLYNACGTYMMNDINNVMAEIEKYEYISDEELASWLQEKVDLMDYAEIIEKLADLEKEDDFERSCPEKNYLC
ncbi:MAG: response regulator [Lachnospiraceae bacterium]|nr:response regulator [Lachnospiraceae bacterium]